MENIIGGGFINKSLVVAIELQPVSLHLDYKMDDGLPQSGNVLAMYNGYSGSGEAIWSNGAVVTNANFSGYTTATSSSSTSCFDNGHVSGSMMQYSITYNNGTGANCALSFKLQ